MAWTLEHIERLAAQGKIEGFKVLGSAQVKAIPAKKKKQYKSPGKAFITQQLEQAGIDFVTEWRFDAQRKFRFDWAVVALRVGIEYEGTMSAKSRHTSVVGYARDADKYNLAQQLGWRVLRYTALNYKNFESDLKEILK